VSSNTHQMNRHSVYFFRNLESESYDKKWLRYTSLSKKRPYSYGKWCPQKDMGTFWAFHILMLQEWHHPLNKQTLGFPQQNENTLKVDYKLKTHSSNSTFNQKLYWLFKNILDIWQWWYAKMISEEPSKNKRLEK